MTATTRRAMALLLVVVMTVLSVISSTRLSHESHVFDHVQSMFTSNALSKHSTREEYVSRYQQYAAKVQGDVSYEHSSKRHPYLVKLREKCGYECHAKLMAALEKPEHYKGFNGDNAQIITTQDNMKKLHEKHGDLMEGYLPMLPEIKIDSVVSSRSEGKWECTTGRNKTPRKKFENKFGEVRGAGRKPLPPYADIEEMKATENLDEYVALSLFVRVAALEESELAEFVTALEHLNRHARAEATENGLHGSPVITFDIEADLVAGRSKFLTVHVSDCRDVDYVARTLSERPEVTWIEPRYEAFYSNRWSSGDCQTGNYKNTPLYLGANLTGEGLFIGVSDSGIDMSSCYFYDPNVAPPYDTVNYNHRKVVAYYTHVDNADDAEGHGTHVAGSTLGQSFQDWGDYKQYQGMAYGAKLVFFDIGQVGSSSVNPPGNLNENMFLIMYNAGARVFVNSWGTTSNGYTGYSSAVDDFMYENPDALVLFAAGNEGAGGSNTVGAPGTAKNCLTVGSNLNDANSWKAFVGPEPNDLLEYGNMAQFSSQGPTSDGRVKPDTLANGWWVTSGATQVNENGRTPTAPTADDYHCSVLSYRGTSMSTPTAAGFATLVREYFLDGYYPSGSANAADGFNPAGSLLKAVMVHAGQKVSRILEADSSGSITYNQATSYPSFAQGYGRIQIDQVLNFGESAQNPVSMFVVGGATSSDKHYVEITQGTRNFYYLQTDASSDQSKIRVTMAFTDVSGSSALQNKVLVMVYHESVDELSYATSTAATSYPYLYTSDADQKNPVQVIDINSPAASTTYTVMVYTSGTFVSATQSYALVATGQLIGLNASEYVSTYDDTPGRFYFTTYFIGILAGLGTFVLMVSCVNLSIYRYNRLMKSARNKAQAEFKKDQLAERKAQYVEFQRQQKAAKEAQRRNKSAGSSPASSRPQSTMTPASSRPQSRMR